MRAERGRADTEAELELGVPRAEGNTGLETRATAIGIAALTGSATGKGRRQSLSLGAAGGRKTTFFSMRPGWSGAGSARSQA